jgi:L-alanine-DL-glutamate epimerase-like enolase superfamily enzyme
VLGTLDDTPLVPGLPTPGEHIGPRELVVLELQTHDGITGLGLTYWHGAMARALAAAVEALAAHVIGADAARTERVAQRLAQVTGRTSAEGNGIFHLAKAAIDMACWDIKGKSAGLPVATMIGGSRARVDAYASGALLRGYSLDCLRETATALAEMGFRQMKLQCGSEPTDEEAVSRVRTVREAVGGELEIMCDMNQLWSAHRARRLGRLLEGFRLAWIEDPIAADDHDGLAYLSRVLRTPVVAGEYEYGIRGFRSLLLARATDIVMIDVCRVGGITPWVKVAAMAEAFNLMVVGHRLPEIDVHLVAGVPNGLTVEYRPLTAGIFEQPPVREGGQLVVPDRPGLGLALSPAAIDRYQLYEAVCVR